MAVALQAVWERAPIAVGPSLESAFPLEAKIAKRCILSSPGWCRLPQRLQLRHSSWIDDRNFAKPKMRQVFTWTTARLPPRMRLPVRRRDLTLCPSPRSAVGSRERREAFDNQNGGLSRMV